MKPMLTEQDLKAIGQVVEEKIETKVPPIVDEKIAALEKRDLNAIGQIVEEKLKPLDAKIDARADEILETVNDGFSEMETRLGKRFDGLDGRMDGFERRLDRTDGKVNTLVNVLQKKRVITEDEKRTVQA